MSGVQGRRDGAKPAPGLRDGESRAAATHARATPIALIADADPELRCAVAQSLRPELDVYLAGSLLEALPLVEGADIALALVALDLPDGRGERLLEQLARRCEGIRVLLLAGRASSAGSAAAARGARSIETPSVQSFLIEDRALVHLLLTKPVAMPVLAALKRAALGLPKA